MAATFRRKQYFVERGLQLRFARFVILFVLVSVLITGLMIFYTTFMLLGEKLADVYPQGRLVSIFRTVHLALIVDALILLPIIFWMSIIFSHRIAGPLPKIYETLKKIGRGEFDQKIVLRKHDELTELVNVINEMAQNLKSKSHS